MKKNTKILILLFVGVMMGALDISIVGPAIPSIARAIHLEEKDLSWIYSIYILFNLVGISLMARLSDFFGRRWIYILAVAVFSLGSIIVAVSHDLNLLLIGRGIQGFGSSGIFPVALAVIGDIFPVEKRGRALGLIGAVFGIAFILGPFIAGVMLLYFDWNALFLVNIPIGILVIVFASFLLPSHKTEGDLKFNIEGILILGIILICFTLALNNIDPKNILDSLGSFNVLFCLILIVLLTPMLIMLEWKNPDPVLNIRLFSIRQVRLVGMIAVGLGLFQSSIVFLPKMAVGTFGVNPSKASFMLLPLVVATALGSPLSGRLIDRLGSRVIVISGLIIIVIGLFLLGAASGNVTFYYLAESLLGLGLAMRASLNYIMLNEVPAKQRASTQGILIVFISIGQLSGAALISSVAAYVGAGTKGYGVAFYIMSVLAMGLFISSFFLKSRNKEIDKKIESIDQIIEKP
jgi:EmrB/QacA subfamily drug resistance transporter